MSVLSGYTTTFDFWGTKFHQLGLPELSLHITVDQITSGFILKPDPGVRLSTNRAIKPSHAQDFANYLVRGAKDQQGKWSVIVPALSLYISPAAVDFEANPDYSAGEVEFGIAKIDKTEPVQIWDGQHRTLGCYLAVEELRTSINDAFDEQSRAKGLGDEEKATEWGDEAKSLQEVRRRLGLIVIPVSIALETNKERIAELFTDVADNAKGINATALARLDQRNVFNRAATALFEGRDGWDRLEGLVDDDNAYVSQNNPHWTTYRDVATVAQTAYLGFGARWTENKEQTTLAHKDDEILQNAKDFYESLAEAFPEIDDVFTGTMDSKELRGGGAKPSLLSSSTTIKALASAWHDLKYGFRWGKKSGRIVSAGYEEPGWSNEDIVAAFKDLPSMDSGSSKILAAFWKNIGVFGEPYVAPTARAGNIRLMSMEIVHHAEGK
jgi:hypothetical protein